MDDSIIPQEWKKFLGLIQSRFPSAIIAGGALRDLIVDNPIKDVDIYIADLDIKEKIKIEEIAALLNIPVIPDVVHVHKDYIKLTHDVKKVKANADSVLDDVEVNKGYVTTHGPATKESFLESFINYIVDIQYNGTLYQLIFVECEPVSFVNRDFDFGICKIYFDGLDFAVTEEFWYDYNNKQLTLSGNHSASQMVHTMFVHRPNLVKKFPGWKVVIDDLGKRPLDQMPPTYQRLKAEEAKPKQPKQAKPIWSAATDWEVVQPDDFENEHGEFSYEMKAKDIELMKRETEKLLKEMHEEVAANSYKDWLSYKSPGIFDVDQDYITKVAKKKDNAIIWNSAFASNKFKIEKTGLDYDPDLLSMMMIEEPDPRVDAVKDLFSIIPNSTK